MNFLLLSLERIHVILAIQLVCQFMFRLHEEIGERNSIGATFIIK
jgi:hypothetical protein